MSKRIRAKRERIRSARRSKRHKGEDYDDDDSSSYDERSSVYRSRSGMMFGICKGLANHLDIDVFWVRFAVVCIACSTAFWPAFGIYIVAALVMKIEPVLPLETEEDEEFYHSYAGSRGMALSRLKRTFESLDRRIQRLENTVTARDYDWDERLSE